MNAKQREYLAKKVEEVYARQKDELEEQEPTRPLLNNYLMAAILTGTIKIKPVDEIKKSLSDRVKSLPSGTDITYETDIYTRKKHSRRRYGRDTEELETIVVLPEDLFVDLAGYNEAAAEYEVKHKEWKQKLEKLYQQKEGLIMKINLGSDDVLDPLIEEVSGTGKLSMSSMHLALMG